MGSEKGNLERRKARNNSQPGTLARTSAREPSEPTIWARAVEVTPTPTLRPPKGRLLRKIYVPPLREPRRWEDARGDTPERIDNHDHQRQEDQAQPPVSATRRSTVRRTSAASSALMCVWSETSRVGVGTSTRLSYPVEVAA